MKLSLRELRKLETRIQAKINEGLINGRAINIHEAFLTNLDMTEGWLAETFAMGDDSLQDQLNFVSARAAVRREIQATNERVGINALIAQRKELITLRSIWGEAVSAYDVENGHAMTPEVLQRVTASAIESAKNSSSNSVYGRRSDTITISTISDELHEAAQSKMRQLIRDVDAVEDKLAGLNATTKVELESTLVDLLENHDLL